VVEAGYRPKHGTQDPNSSSSTSPIFILGIMPRCGTNFLSNLLALHPDCAPPETVWEDFTVAHANLLKRYSERVARNWNPKWGVTEKTREEFNASLGKGISTFLTQRSGGKHIIAKTPRVDNVDLFFDFFPNARLLIQVRDGKAILESGIRSFGWSREAALHWLADSAQEIARFRQSHDENVFKYRIVKYEDLWQKPKETMRELLGFLSLPEEVYDFDMASQLPVRGSSDLVNKNNKELHWDPVKKPTDFDPMSRSDHWSPVRHQRYNHIAGQHMEALGYTARETTGLSWARSTQNQLLDASWRLKSVFRPVYHYLRKKP
jgi:hypothetical protein